MTTDQFDNVLSFIRRLEEAKIFYQMESYRYDGISVVVTVPGQRWEVDFLADGEVDVEKFVSNGEIDDESALDELFAKFTEPMESALKAANPNGVVTY